MTSVITQSSSSSMTSTDINGKQTINKDSSSSFKRHNDEKPELNLEEKSKDHFDLGGEKGRFHKKNSFRQKKYHKPWKGSLQKIEGNLKDGVRKDEASVDTGKKIYKLDLHSALERIKQYKTRNTKLHFSKGGCNLLSYRKDNLPNKLDEGGKQQ